MSEKILPLPEILDGAVWEVRDSGDEDIAYVDLKNKQMVVPTTDTAKSEYLRAHEAMHVKITPRDFGSKDIPEGVKNRTLQALEDCRVNSALKKAGIDIDLELRGEKQFSAIAVEPYEIEAVRWILATRGTADESKIRSLASINHPRANAIADQILDRYFSPAEAQGRIPDFETVKAAAVKLHELVEEPPEREQQQQGGSMQRGEGQAGDEEVEQQEQQEDSEEDSEQSKESEQRKEEEKEKENKQEKPKNNSNSDSEKKEDKEEKPQEGMFQGNENDSLMEPFDSREANRVKSFKIPDFTQEEKERVSKAGVKFRGDGGLDKPGRLLIETPPLEKAFEPKRIVKIKGYDSGTNPQFIHRYATDKQIFAHRASKFGGAAVLIDCSGSMYFGTDQIVEILKQCPSTIVAIYSGKGSEGILRVIAEGKRQVNPEILQGNSVYSNAFTKGMGDGNIVDIPALEWLARRKEKNKVWISDGVIAGEGDRPLDPKYLRKAANIIESARIVRVSTLSGLLKSGRLVEYRANDFGSYDEDEITPRAKYNINGFGCGICAAPNCGWWARWKAAYLRAKDQGLFSEDAERAANQAAGSG